MEVHFKYRLEEQFGMLDLVFFHHFLLILLYFVQPHLFRLQFPRLLGFLDFS